ncbi:MAG: HD domain-containing phosphohydrolase [Planctomycetota bacterium]
MSNALQHADTTVLIADDEPGIRRLICQGLSQRNFHTHAVEDVASALSFLASHRVDALVADIALPDGTGLDLAQAACQHQPNCPVVLITGRHQRDYLIQALLLGAYDYIEKPFDPDELGETLTEAISQTRRPTRLCQRAAEALELRTRSREAALQSVRALARAVEAKDPFTRRHSDHVAHYATALAGELALDAAGVESIRVAALLHDVGKIGVPDHILTKPAGLTEEEFAHIRRHPDLGAEIVSGVRAFHVEAELVRRHHERWDGRGYPDGWVADRVPLGARIIGVADAMDAILMPRTYKPGMSRQYMGDELVAGAGSQFDPDVAEAAAAWARANPDRLILPGGEETPAGLRKVV